MNNLKIHLAAPSNTCYNSTGASSVDDIVNDQLRTELKSNAPCRLGFQYNHDSSGQIQQELVVDCNGVSGVVGSQPIEGNEVMKRSPIGPLVNAHDSGAVKSQIQMLRSFFPTLEERPKQPVSYFVEGGVLDCFSRSSWSVG